MFVSFQIIYSLCTCRQQYRRETFYQLAAGSAPHSINKLFSCLVQLQLIQERFGAGQNYCKEHKSCITRLAAVNWRDGIQLMTEVMAGLPPSLDSGSPSLVAAVTNLLKVRCCVPVSQCMYVMYTARLSYWITRVPVHCVFMRQVRIIMHNSITTCTRVLTIAHVFPFHLIFYSLTKCHLLLAKSL